MGAEVDSESANLMSKAQAHEVLKMINVREGLFNEDDLKQLEGGYSVSDTEDDLGSAINDDPLSVHSIYNQ